MKSIQWWNFLPNFHIHTVSWLSDVSEERFHPTNEPSDGREAGTDRRISRPASLTPRCFYGCYFPPVHREKWAVILRDLFNNSAQPQSKFTSSAWLIFSLGKCSIFERNNLFPFESDFTEQELVKIEPNNNFRNTLLVFGCFSGVSVFAVRLLRLMWPNKSRNEFELIQPRMCPFQTCCCWTLLPVSQIVLATDRYTDEALFV